MRSWCDVTSNGVRSMFVSCREVPPKWLPLRRLFCVLYGLYEGVGMQPALICHAHVRHAASSQVLYHILGLVLYRSRYSA
jgi:hypothetical protein